MKKIVHILIALSYAAIIFYLSSTSSPPNPVTPANLVKIYQFLKAYELEFLAYPFYLAFRYPDKLAHFLLYFGFGIALNPAVKGVFGRRHYSLTILIGSLYAFSDEVHQMFTPGRSPSFADFLADVSGLLISQLVMIFWTNKNKMKELLSYG